MKSPIPNKSLGQHWLHDEDILERIAEAAEVGESDTVLEVGPGLGTLTEILVKRAGTVEAVEFDQDLARDLPARVSANNLNVTSQDILSFDLSHLPADYKVAANIPYYLTSHLVRKLQESQNPPSVSVLLVQKEVAERIAAQPGAMSLLSVASQFFSDVSLDVLVPAELFTPPPKVDSQVIVLKRKQELPSVDQKSFFRIVKAGFGERRKKLANSLSGGLGLDKSVVAEILAGLGHGENVRAQELSIEQWLAVHDKISAILNS